MGEKKINIEDINFMSDMNEEEQTQFENIISGKEDVNAINIIKKLANA